MIKKWLTVVAAAAAVTTFALLPAKADKVDAAPPPAEPGCGITAVCWFQH